MKIQSDKIPFIIHSGQHVKNLKTLISWLLNSNILPVDIFVLHNNSDDELKAFLNECKDHITPVVVNKKYKFSDIHRLTIQCPKFFFYVEPSVLPARICPKNLLKHMVDIYSKYPYVHRISAHMDKPITKQTRDKLGLIGRVSKKFCLYKNSHSNYNECVNNILTKQPYRVIDTIEKPAKETKDLSYTELRQLLKGKRFTYHSKKVTSNITFKSNSECVLDDGSAGDVTLTGDTIKIKWRTFVKGVCHLVFNDSFTSFRGSSNKEGIVTGSIQHIFKQTDVTAQMLHRPVKRPNLKSRRSTSNSISSMPRSTVPYNTVGKKTTFVIPVKNRNERVIECLETLVNPTTSLFSNFILVEDIGKRRIDLSSFKYAYLVDHYTVNTSQSWNKSKLVNFALTKTTTDYLSVCDVDFRFDKCFFNKYIDLIKEIYHTNSYIRMVCTETDECFRRGVKFRKGQLYGGFYTYLVKHMKAINGYDESFTNWGYEDTDFHQRMVKFNKLTERAISVKNVVYHKSHNEGRIDTTLQNNVSQCDTNILSRTNKVNLRGYGNIQLIDKKISCKTIVIMGNGPSLKNVNFQSLSTFDTFGMNLAYRHWEKINWWPTYHACFDYVVTDNHTKEFKKLIERPDSDIRMHFLLRPVSSNPKLKVMKFKDDKTGSFSMNLDNFGYGGNTGVNCCQIAACLGYQKIILIGIDCDYVQVVDGAKLVGSRLITESAPTTNPNYFMDDYNRPGDVYNVPNAEIHHRPAWKSFAEFAKQHSIDVINCSQTSTLKCFRKGDLNVELGIC